MCFESIPDAPRWCCDCLTGATNVYHSAAESSSRWTHCLIPFESWFLQNNTVPSFTLNICDSFRESAFFCHNKSNRYKKMSSILFIAAVFTENCAEYCSVRWNRFLNIWMHKDYRSIEIIYLPGLNVGDEVKKKEAIHQMCFTVQLILNAQFHICVDFFSLQEIADTFFLSFSLFYICWYV